MNESIFYPHWQQPHNVSKATFSPCYTLLILTVSFALVISSHIFCCCLVPRPCPILLPPHGLCSLPGSSIHEISQAGILEWVAISFSRGSSQTRDQPAFMHWQVNSSPLSHQESPSRCYFIPLCKIPVN